MCRRTRRRAPFLAVGSVGEAAGSRCGTVPRVVGAVRRRVSLVRGMPPVRRAAGRLERVHGVSAVLVVAAQAPGGGAQAAGRVSSACLRAGGHGLGRAGRVVGPRVDAGGQRSAAGPDSRASTDRVGGGPCGRGAAGSGGSGGQCDGGAVPARRAAARGDRARGGSCRALELAFSGAGVGLSRRRRGGGMRRRGWRGWSRRSGSGACAWIT